MGYLDRTLKEFNGNRNRHVEYKVIVQIIDKDGLLIYVLTMDEYNNEG